MNFSAKLFSVALAALSCCPDTAMARGNSYAVINFFDPTDPASAEMDKLIEGAKVVLEEKAASGEWTPRKIKKWLSVDIVNDKDKVPEGVTGPSQMVFNNNWDKDLEKLINFEAVTSSFSTNRREDEERFAKIIHELTGDWYTEKDCDTLLSKAREFTSEVIYFGPKEDFEEVEGNLKAIEFILLAQIDRYWYEGTHPEFIVNHDAECHDKIFGEDQGSIIAFFNQETQPTFGEVSYDLDINVLIHTLNKKMVSSNPTWSERYRKLIEDYEMNILIYMTPEPVAEADRSDDWRISLMTSLRNVLDQSDIDFKFLPLIWSWEEDASIGNPVGDLLKFSKIDEQPQFYLYTSPSNQSVIYPDEQELDAMSPIVLLGWANFQAAVNNFVHFRVKVLQEIQNENIPKSEQEDLQLQFDHYEQKNAGFYTEWQEIKADTKENNNFADQFRRRNESKKDKSGASEVTEEKDNADSAWTPESVQDEL